MRLAAGVFSWVFGLLFAGAALAECPSYEVQRGDTLRLIAERYYGTRDASGRIYRANSNRIGENPNLIEPGQVLYIPCADPDNPPVPAKVPSQPERPENPQVVNVSQDAPEVDALISELSDTHADKIPSNRPSETSGNADAGPTDAASEALPMLEMPAMPNRMYILTGGPFAPFVGAELPGGGMVAELVHAALTRRGGPEPEMVFVNDRASHLEGIMPKGGFALTFPWVFPTCDGQEKSRHDRFMCDTYRPSDGFYEFVTEFYARADTPWAGILIPSALDGARICRPEGYPVADLYKLGLMPDKVTLLRGRDSIDCLMMVDRAEADVASMDAAVTRSLIDQITVKNPILVLEPLTTIHKLRVLALKSNPRSAEMILNLNAGLKDLSEDGSWYEIVNRHLQQGGS